MNSLEVIIPTGISLLALAIGYQVGLRKDRTSEPTQGTQPVDRSQLPTRPKIQPFGRKDKRAPKVNDEAAAWRKEQKLDLQDN